MINTIKNMSKFEVLLWLVSAVSVTTAFLISGGFGVLTLAASLVGVTSLIFLAKGDVTGRVLMVIFSVLYAIISYGQKYYGEMITYMGMTAPIAVLSIITWLRNPYGKNQVKIRQLSVWGFAAVTGAVTVVFYFILKVCGNVSLFFSTASVATSFFAASLTMLRSKYYTAAYACNDIVLIILWILAAKENINFLSMVVCFTVFLANDFYGFICWCKMERMQSHKGI